MAMSLFDHEQRLHDLELALEIVLGALLRDQPDARLSVQAAARSLRGWGEAGAADLLTSAASRPYAR